MQHARTRGAAHRGRAARGWRRSLSGRPAADRLDRRHQPGANLILRTAPEKVEAEARPELASYLEVVEADRQADGSLQFRCVATGPRLRTRGRILPRSVVDARTASTQWQLRRH